MDINLYVRKVGHKYAAYSEEMLAQCEQKLDSKEKVDAFFAESGGGEWHKLEMLEPFMGQHDTLVKQRCLTKGEDGRKVHDPTKWEDAVVSVAVQDWTLNKPANAHTQMNNLYFNADWTPDMEGMQFLPIKLAQVIRAVVVSEVYGDCDDPAFNRASLSA